MKRNDFDARLAHHLRSIGRETCSEADLSAKPRNHLIFLNRPRHSPAGAFLFSENAMTLKKLLGYNERTGFSETSIIICAVLTGAGICALGISLCLLMRWAVLNGYVL